MSDADDGEKQYDPTPQRREQFRNEGRVARAKDATGVAATAAVALVLLGSRPVLAHATHALFTGTLGDLGALGRTGGERALSMAVWAFAAMAAPAAMAAALAATLVSLAQSGLELRPDALELKPERLNPLSGLRQLFSFKHGASETALGLLRVGLVGYAAWRALARDLPALTGLARVPLDAAVGRCAEAVTRVTFHALGALAAIAAVDYAWSWWSLEQEMKMTRRELTEETKSQEGDPKAKGQMRARARATLRKRSLANVKKADVVVTNPTHVAVALRYAPTDPAPVVIAKGHDAVALQIRAEARRHGIPILENRPLARALDAEVPIGRAVPGKHFAAVARVLAWVYRVRPSARRVRSAKR
jgi:flagellar biosynthetic protein FlhB